MPVGRGQDRLGQARRSRLQSDSRCNPAPGAWTTFNGKKLQIFDARKILFRRFADVPGKIGEVTDVTPQSFKVVAQGGVIEVLKAKFEDGKKLSGGELAQSGGDPGGQHSGLANLRKTSAKSSSV